MSFPVYKLMFFKKVAPVLLLYFESETFRVGGIYFQKSRAYTLWMLRACVSHVESHFQKLRVNFQREYFKGHVSWKTFGEIRQTHHARTL